jgi:hypothetical protein
LTPSLSDWRRTLEVTGEVLNEWYKAKAVRKRLKFQDCHSKRDSISQQDDIVTRLTKGNDRIRDTVVAIPRTTTGFHCDNNTRQLVSYSPAAEEVSVYASYRVSSSYSIVWRR